MGKKNKKSNRKFKVAKPARHYDYFSQMPCGRCPVIHLCSEGAEISPENCEYYTKWLAQDSENLATHGHNEDKDDHDKAKNKKNLSTQPQSQSHSMYQNDPYQMMDSISPYGGGNGEEGLELAYEENEDDDLVMEGRF